MTINCKARFVFLCILLLSVFVTAHPAEKTSFLKPASPMHEMRASHTATLLPGGKVLIVGGFKKIHTYDQTYFNTAELFNPQTGEFNLAGTLTVPRCGHTATLLPDNRVLIAGGGNGEPLASAEIYSPVTGRFTPIGTMAVPREGHTATLLRNGSVLIVGGGAEGKQTAELFDTVRQMFVPAGNLHENRIGHTATLLGDGRVLIAGGAVTEERGHSVMSSAEIFNPSTGEFTITGKLSMPRYKHAAVLLPDSTVLIVGGSDQHDWTGQYNSAEVYDPRLGTFSKITDMEGKRFKLPNGVALLADGTVLIAGGGKKVEIYDPAKKSFTTVSQFDEPHFYSTATRLLDGTVLIAGGYNTQPQSTEKAWVYEPK